MQRKIFIALLAIICCFNPVFSQQESIESYFELSLEELLNVGIVSATQKKQSVLDAPAAAYVVTKEQILLRGYNSLLEVLEDIPEIEIQRNSNNEQQNILTIRGVTGNEKLVILRNGFRISPALGETYTFGSQFNIREAERVEIILGPASALYGADAFSGIVNIVYPEKNNDQKTEIHAQTSGGNYASTTNNLYIGHKLEKMYFAFNGNYNQTAGANMPDLYKDDYSWYNNQQKNNHYVYESPFYLNIYPLEYFKTNAGNSYSGPNANTNYSRGAKAYNFNVSVWNDKFHLGYSKQYEEHSSSTGLDPRFAVYDENAKIKTVQNNITSRYKYVSFNERWNLLTNINISYFEILPESNWLSSVSRYQRGYYYSFTQSSNIDQKFQYDISDRTSLIVGVSGEYASALPKTSLSPTPFDKKSPPSLQDYYYIGAAGYNPYTAPGDSVIFYDSLTVQQEIYPVNYVNTGAYAQLVVNPFNNLEITMGLRYDKNSRYGSTFNPRIGLVFEPSLKVKWKLLYGESYLSPSPSKSFSQYGSFFGSAQNTDNLYADIFHVANPSLKPEKLRSLESSLNIFVTKNLSLTVNGFYTHITNLINQFSTTSNNTNTQIKAFKLETSVNEGLSETYGGTFSAKYLHKIGHSSLNWYAAFSYIDGHINGKILPFTTKETVKVGLDLENKKWGASIRGIFRSGTYSDKQYIGTNLEIKSPAYFTTNLNIYYKLLKKHDVKLFATVSNLTNQRYYNVYYGNEEGFPITPQDPLTFIIGLRYEL